MKRHSGSSLRFNVDRIPDDGLIVQASEPADRFPALQEAVREGTFQFDLPLQMEVRLRRVSRFVEASGQIQTSVRLSCSRCLENCSHSVTVLLEATYSDEPPDPETSMEESEIELSSESIDIFPIHGREIDLLEAIQEQVLLALPVRPLCREECKGLCSRCGADLNQGECQCSEGPVDPRFAALKNLKIVKG